MYIERLKLVNYLSFEDEEFLFPQHPLQVQGVNKTDDDQKSNGSGKSGFAAGLQQAYCNSNSRKERESNMIRRGQKEAIIECDTYCQQRNERLSIVRVLKKSGTTLNLFINGEPVEFSTVKDGNEYIFGWLGSNKEDLLSYFIIDGERFKSFFSSSNRERLDLIGRLADTGFVDDAEGAVKVDAGELVAEITSQHKVKDKTEGRLDEILNQIDELSVPVDDQTETLIQKVEDDISGLTLTLSDKLAEKIKQEALIKPIGKKILKLKADFIECEGRQVDVTDIQAMLKEFRGEVVSLNREKSQAENKISGEITCPKCSHGFVLKANVDIKAEQLIISSIAEELIELNESIEVCLEDIVESDKLKDELRVIQKDIERNENSVSATNRSINRIETSITSIKGDIELKRAKIKQINEAVPTDNTALIEAAKQKQVEVEGSLVTIDAEIVALEESLFEVKQWETNFKRFKMHLANQTLKQIQDTCNTFLSKMKSDLRVRVDGFKVKADGTIKEEINPVVIRNDEASFFSYSGGERGRVQFAMILAIQELINSRNKYGGLNFLSMDEVLEGIDTEGLAALMRSIKDLGITALIVTHVSDENIDEYKLIIEKINGISKIKRE